MARFLHLSIRQPCHENWDTMQDMDSGRFCQSCQKQVIDFTLVSDADLVNYFKKLNGGVCGRLTQQQLQAEYALPSRKIHWLRYFFQVAIPALLFSAKANAQLGKISVAPRHIVDKKKVKSEIPVMETNSKCSTLNKPEEIVEPAKSQEEVVVFAGGITSGVRIRNWFPPVPGIINPAVANKISIFPNPAFSGSTIFIQWKQTTLNNHSVEIFDPSGNLVQQQTLKPVTKNKRQEIHLNNLPAGLYILRTKDLIKGTVLSGQLIIH